MRSINFSSIKRIGFAVAVIFYFGNTDSLFAQNGEYFDSGSIQYLITYKGKGASDFKKNAPPTAMDLHIFEDNYIINLKAAPGDSIRTPRTFLFIGDSNRRFIVDMQKQKYYLRDYYQGDTLVEAPRAAKGKDTLTIRGFKCHVYRVKKPNVTTYYYVSDDLRVNPKYFEGKDAKADFMIKGLDGRIPIRKVVESNGIKATSEIQKITKVQHTSAMFRIPRGFERKKRDPRW